MNSVAVMGLALLAVVGAGAFIAFKLIQAIVWLLLKLFMVIGMMLRAVGTVMKGTFRHVGGFSKDMAVDGLHTFWAGLTAGTIVPLTLGNLLIGRWPAAKHYGTALQDEITSVGLGLYRLTIGHPLRFILSLIHI